MIATNVVPECASAASSCSSVRCLYMECRVVLTFAGLLRPVWLCELAYRTQKVERFEDNDEFQDEDEELEEGEEDEEDEDGEEGEDDVEGEIDEEEEKKEKNEAVAEPRQRG